MGHGPARELENDSEPTRNLPAALSTKLDEALGRMDQFDEGFRHARDEERLAQMAKRWGQTSKAVLDLLRDVTKVLHAGHQVSLDVGADGGGRATRPWVEETSNKFDRLYLTLEEGGSVLAISGNMTLARCTIDELTYPFLEKLVVVWVVKSIDARTRGMSQHHG